jgi:hypothetical protein
MRKTKLGEIPLDIYAEYAAYFSPESLDLFMRKRLEVSSAILIQYHYRRHRARRNEFQMNRLVLYRLLKRWKRVTNRTNVVLAIESACKSFIAKSLLLFLQSERIDEEYRVFHSIIFPKIMAYMCQLALRPSIVKPVQLPPPSPTPSPPPSPPQSPPKTISEEKRRRRVFEVASSSDEESYITNNSGIGIVIDNVFSEQHVLESPEANVKEDLAGIRQKILVHLITRLQALFRGRQGRARVRRLRRELMIKRETEAKMEELRKAVFKAAEERENRRSGKTSAQSSKGLDERASIRRLPRPTVPEIVEQPQAVLPVLKPVASPPRPESPPPVLVTPRLEKTQSFVDEKHEETFVYEPDEEIVVPTTPVIPDNHGEELRAINAMKATILSFLCQGVLILLEANALVNSAAQGIESAVALLGFENTANRKLSIILPQNVDGVIEGGLLVDESSPIKGASIGGQGWAVADLTEAEVYELHPKHISKAASKIQKIFRRFLTRRKFIAYLQEKELDTVREEERTTEVSGGVITASADAVNTDSCVIS